MWKQLYYSKQPLEKLVETSEHRSEVFSDSIQTSVTDLDRIEPDFKRYCTPCTNMSDSNSGSEGHLKAVNDTKHHLDEIEEVSIVNGGESVDLTHAQSSPAATASDTLVKVEDLFADESWPHPENDELANDEHQKLYKQGLEEDGTLYQILQDSIPPQIRKPKLRLDLTFKTNLSPRDNTTPKLQYSHGDPNKQTAFTNLTRNDEVEFEETIDSMRPATAGEIGRSRRRQQLRTQSAHPKKKKKVIKKKPSLVLPHVTHKYKPPDEKSMSRNYRQPWNEKAKLDPHDTEYVEIHYEPYLPKDAEEYKYRHLEFTCNHKHGSQYEYRIRTEPPKKDEGIKKVERVWENEFKIFQLNKMLESSSLKGS